MDGISKIYPEKDQTWKNMYLKLNFYMIEYQYIKTFFNFFLAAKNGHLEVVKYLSTLPNVDVSACDNWAIIWPSYAGHLEVVKYLSNLPNVDASARNNWAIKMDIQKL